MIKISGNSNYKVSVVKTDKLYIIKEGFTKEDTLRLQKQIEKQERFSESNKYTIKTAKIINKDNTRYTMEYIKSYDMINYLNTVEFNSIKNMINNIVKLVNTFIKESDMIIIEKSLIINKLNSINENLQRYHKNSIVIECINYLYENINIFEKEIPIGACHGDLTLSNMLVDYNHNLYLIDFLDDFMNTPLFDIIKLRQDFKYKYVLQLYTGNYDKIRIEQLFNYFDKLISNEFKQYSCYFKYLDIMNYLRILQYSKNKDLESYLLKQLVRILDN